MNFDDFCVQRIDQIYSGNVNVKNRFEFNVYGIFHLSDFIPLNFFKIDFVKF